MALAGWVGLLLALAVMLGQTNAAAMFVLWALYPSVVHVGSLGYGWETQPARPAFWPSSCARSGRPACSLRAAAAPGRLALPRLIAMMLGAG
jgi:hypothetical protein